MTRRHRRAGGFGASFPPVRRIASGDTVQTQAATGEKGVHARSDPPRYDGRRRRGQGTRRRIPPRHAPRARRPHHRQAGAHAPPRRRPRPARMTHRRRAPPRLARRAPHTRRPAHLDRRRRLAAPRQERRQARRADRQCDPAAARATRLDRIGTARLPPRRCGLRHRLHGPWRRSRAAHDAGAGVAVVRVVRFRT